jgi:hypothetical protein
MSVVLRCPSCGTTRASPGECEACHEASARYFCTNHEPGEWLKAKTCEKCGARFGAPSRAVTLRPRRATVRSPPDAPEITPEPALVAAPSRLPSPELGSYALARAERRRIDIAERELDPVRLSPPFWQQLLAAALRARRAPAPTAPGSVLRPVARGLGGCVMRAVVVSLLLFMALLVALFFFGRSLLLGY